ncbi:hypothetical protein [Mycoavidus sp. B2-EB]|uniref:hypothetical protein n=1 Tax=Mycoavidus sp. B2-EB TaxID=2651972 RepID=UPI001625E80E|nr:hypothetical protein [Mycoavidus sp. B2-EB]BBO59091.1 hypothetical protein MPB2EB_0192 [Mycoavidus sp. B2-EB]
MIELSAKLQNTQAQSQEIENIKSTEAEILEQVAEIDELREICRTIGRIVVLKRQKESSQAIPIGREISDEQLADFLWPDRLVETLRLRSSASTGWDWGPLDESQQSSDSPQGSPAQPIIMYDCLNFPCNLKDDEMFCAILFSGVDPYHALPH